jgi:general transcriptional corepressor TUP1
MTSDENPWIISGSKDGGVIFWDPATGQSQCLLLVFPITSVVSVAAQPNGRGFATASIDKKARLWTY